jgi:hypothetical protein
MRKEGRRGDKEGEKRMKVEEGPQMSEAEGHGRKMHSAQHCTAQNWGAQGSGVVQEAVID